MVWECGDGREGGPEWWIVMLKSPSLDDASLVLGLPDGSFRV
jgi:hypothetical protein